MKRKSTRHDQPLRLGTVPYCNAWPLTHFLSQEIPGSIVSEWFPADMRLRLMAHHLDLVLMPVAELMNLSYGKIVSDCCIGCRGPVRSVLLVSRKPLPEIKTLSLDTASRSSVTLCELMLRHFYDISPEKYKLPADKPLDSCKTDAFVVIGDRALAFRQAAPWEYCYDLGSLWKEKTGLPFVFAAWIGCSPRAWNHPNITASLQAARDAGLRSIGEILDAKEATNALFPVAKNVVADYLTHAIHYRIGDDERLAIQSFFDLAVLHGLTKQRTVAEFVT